MLFGIQFYEKFFSSCFMLIEGRAGLLSNCNTRSAGLHVFQSRSEKGVFSLVVSVYFISMDSRQASFEPNECLKMCYFNSVLSIPTHWSSRLYTHAIIWLHGHGSFRSHYLVTPSKNCKHFMESESLLPGSQQPDTGPYFETGESSPHFPSHFFKFHFNIIVHLRLGLPRDLFPSGFATKTLHTLPSRACYIPCKSHLS
jgi:hypothetical protein